MRKPLRLLVFICIIFIPFASYSQAVVQLPDMVRLCLRSPGDFEAFVHAKGYSIKKRVSGEITQIYASNKPNANRKKNMISRTMIPHAAAKIEFTTTDKKWYFDTKALLSKAGYRFVNDEKRTLGGIQTDMYNFTNGKCHVTLYSYTTDVTWYAAQVHY